MGNPAHSDDGSDDDVKQLLRKLEPTLRGISSEQARQAKVLERLDARTEAHDAALQKLETRSQSHSESIARVAKVLERLEARTQSHSESIARLEGKVGQLPTLIQVATAVAAINAISVGFAFGIVQVIVAMQG